MRSEHASLTGASRTARTTPRSVLRTFPDAIRREAGRYVAAPADREPFLMRIVSTEGVVERIVRGSRARSALGRHHAAIGQYLGPDGGESDLLAPFGDKRIAGVELEADPDQIELLLRQHELDFLDIYPVF